MKWVFGSILSILLLFSFFASVSAATSADTALQSAEDLKNNLDNVNDVINSPDKDQIAADYLKKEWGEILRKKPIIGELLRGYDTISPYTSPVIKWAVGLAPAVSWIFILTFFIWFTFIRYSNLFYDAFADMGVFTKPTSKVIYLCFLVIVLVLQILQRISIILADLIIKFFSNLFLTWWGQTILVVGTILTLTLLNMFNKRFRVFLRAWRMKRYQERVKQAAEKVEKQKEKP